MSRRPRPERAGSPREALRRDDGAIAIMVAIFAVVLFGMAAAVVDVGDGYDVRARAQQAVDAAATAGVRELAADDNGTTSPTDLAIHLGAVVRSYVAANISITDAAWSACSDPQALATVVPDTSCISFETPGRGAGDYEVRVALPTRHVPATFAGIFGIESLDVHPLAVGGEGVIAASPCQPCSPVLDANGQPVEPPALPAAVTLPDPASLSPPTAPPTPDVCPTPGRYDIDVTAHDCTLSAGLYVFDDHTFSVTGPVVSDAGVTLVFYGTATLSVTAQGTLHLVATQSPDAVADARCMVPPTTTPSVAPTSVSPSTPPTPPTLPPASTPPPVSTPAATPTPSPPSPPTPGIVGVAIVFATSSSDRTPAAAAAAHPFSLGTGFCVTGSVYALNARWVAGGTECPAVAPCRLDQGVLSVEATDFGNDPIPSVATDEAPVRQPPDNKPHLVR